MLNLFVFISDFTKDSVFVVEAVLGVVGCSMKIRKVFFMYFDCSYFHVITCCN